ncbi:hypothetical protein O1611_g6492 [Lasiodiplodia mahajangana]|uniref:Uncharacterized protein n=1 Tax=Lasiodiplodia mahajangana TaxID=1108764 RepID=A0ACC2JI22_9PEZI|nr:hypothetical protein O1611_g6492 [Lasiodiplodia mahajangana]
MSDENNYCLSESALPPSPDRIDQIIQQVTNIKSQISPAPTGAKEPHIQLGYPKTQSDRVRPLRSKKLHYAFACCGSITGIFFLATFLAAGFLPPLPPSYTAEQVAEHYRNHETGIHVAGVLSILTGVFWLPYAVVISDQMRRIPNIPWILPALQLASGVLSTIGFTVPGTVLGVAGFRIDWDAATLQLLNDMFWIFSVMPLYPFVLMAWVWCYAILIDDRDVPLYPKYMAVVTFITTAMLLWSAAIHVTKNGPFAWNGAFGFWVPFGAFGVEVAVDAYFLLRAIRRDYFEEPERIESDKTC